MNENATPPLPIDWHDGMLLVPGHFQSLADRIDALATYYVRQVMPFHWGVLSLQIDPSLLLQGTLRIDHLDAILPDGLVISGAGGEGELQIDLTTREADFQHGPVMVHVVAARSRGYAHGQSRFKSVEGKADGFGSDLDPDHVLPLLAPRLELWTGVQPPSRFVSLPLIEIESRHEGYVATAFQPPVPQLQTAAWLVAEVSDLCLEVRKKALAVLEDANGPFAKDVRAASWDARAIVAALSAELPTLEAIVKGPGTTPLELHRSLLRMAGHLAVLGDWVVPPSFAPYRHQSLQACFRPPIDFIHQRLASIRLQTQEIPFAGTGDQFELELEPGWSEGGSLLIGLRCPPGVDGSEVAAWFAAATIAPTAKIETLMANRTIGAGRRAIAQDDGMRLASRANLLLYRVDWPAGHGSATDTVVIVNRLSGKGQTAPASVVLFAAPPSNLVENAS